MYIAKSPVIRNSNIEITRITLVQTFFFTLKDRIESTTGIRSNSGIWSAVPSGKSFQLNGLSVIINTMATTESTSRVMDMPLRTLCFSIFFGDQFVLVVKFAFFSELLRLDAQVTLFNKSIVDFN